MAKYTYIHHDLEISKRNNNKSTEKYDIIMQTSFESKKHENINIFTLGSGFMKFIHTKGISSNELNPKLLVIESAVHSIRFDQKIQYPLIFL